MAQQTVTTWYLEQTDPAQLRHAKQPHPAPQILRAEIASPELNRFLYTAVGGDWHWTDRLAWTRERWLKYLARAEVQTWLMLVQGTPAGYVELELQTDANVEIAYFGLIKPFLGRGLGGPLLGAGLEAAWQMGAQRVWVHTCSLDGAHALANYQARGMHLYKTETLEKDVPPAPGPWPGADAP